MEDEARFRYIENPANSHGIVRAQTAGLRSWESPRTDTALATFQSDWEEQPYPGNYILFLPAKRVYIGEAKDLFSRLRNHFTRPEKKFAKWD